MLDNTADHFLVGTRLGDSSTRVQGSFQVYLNNVWFWPISGPAREKIYIAISYSKRIHKEEMSCTDGVAQEYVAGIFLTECCSHSPPEPTTQ